MTLSEEVRRYVQTSYLAPARRRDEEMVQIKAGDVHRGLHWVNRVPSVCTTLRSQKFQREAGLELVTEEGPPSGMGTRMIYTYRLAKSPEPVSSASKQSKFDALRGIAKDVFRELGGGEKFIRQERDLLHFIKPDSTHGKGNRK